MGGKRDRNLKGRGKRKGEGGRGEVKGAEEKNPHVEWEIRAAWQDQAGIAVPLRRASFKIHGVQYGSHTIPLVMLNLHS